MPDKAEIEQIEKKFAPVEKLFSEAVKLNEIIEEKDIDRSEDPEGEAYNFLDYEERYSVLKDIINNWKSEKVRKIGDIDMAGLSGVDDEEDLEFDEGDELDVDFFEEILSDFSDYFRASIKSMQNLL